MASDRRLLLASLTFLLLTAATGISLATNAAQPVLSLSAQDIASLARPSQGRTPVAIASNHSKRDTIWRFHAIALQAGSQPLADDPDGDLAKRRFLISERGSRQIALAFEADGRFAFGFLDDQNGLQKLVAQPDDQAGLKLFAEVIDQPPVNCEADSIAAPAFQPLQLNAAAPPSPAKGGVSGYQAKVAVEIDYPMMNTHFGNSPAAAMDWLQELFLATNLFYQRDLALQLVMATPVIVNTSPDPYCTGANPCSPLGPYLMFQFGENWRNVHAAIDRDFAALISGRLTGGNPSGISWTSQYCQKGFDTSTPFGTQTAGSYGVNLYVAGAGVSGGSAAELFGHELGHSLGAEHNNCTDSNPGVGGLQPIDQCSNQPNSLGEACWAGSLSCPTSGAGLIMSTGCASLAGCALNRQREFHPVQISLLSGKIAANTPGCLSAATLPNPDILYYDGFE